jgi:hypothetical protein
MTHANRTSTSLIMLAGGTMSSLAVSALLAVIQSKLHLSLYGFSVGYIVPLGAILAGFVSALGYRVGFFRFPYRPYRLIMGGVMAVSVATYFAVNFFAYSFSKIGAQPASTVMPFATYLDRVIRNTNVLGVGSFGVFGYALALRDIVGFAIGGFVLCYPILSLPFCERCESLLDAVKTATAYSRTMSSLKEKYDPAKDLLVQQRGEDASQLISRPGVKAADAVFRLQLKLLRCRACSKAYYDLSVAQMKPRKEVDDLHVRMELT